MQYLYEKEKGELLKKWIVSVMEKQRSFFRSGITLDVNWRITQLKNLKKTVSTYRTELLETLYKDIPGYDGSLTLAMTSEGSMTLSGTLTYIDHDWEFSTVINKNIGDELLESPSEILAGVWKFDNTQTGAYVSSTGMLSNITPEDIDVSLAFGSENNSAMSMAASYYVTLNSARTALDNESNASSSKFMSIMTTSGALTQISGSLYKFTDENSQEALIFIEDSEKIYVFTSDCESDSESGSNSTAFMYLPMTKSSGFDIESLMGKSWSASGSTSGGGYVHFTNLENSTDPIKKALANLSYILKSFSLSFSDVNMNNDSTVTAIVNLSSVFTLTSEAFKKILNQDDLDMDSLEINSEQHTLDVTGNILKLAMTDEEALIYISFISESEALLTIEMKSSTGDEYDGTAKFTALLTAN